MLNYFTKVAKSSLLMTQKYTNFTLKFVAFLFIKLPESENACKQNVWSSLAQTSNPVFSRSSAREIEQDNRQATPEEVRLPKYVIKEVSK